MPNINITSAITIQATDIVSGVTPVNIALNGILLPITVQSNSDFFQVQTGATVIPLPAAIVYYAFIRNLGANPVTLTVTYNPTSVGSCVLSPVTNGFGGIFLYAQTAENPTGPNSNGITGITAQTISVVTPVQYFVAA